MGTRLFWSAKRSSWANSVTPRLDPPSSWPLPLCPDPRCSSGLPMHPSRSPCHCRPDRPPLRRSWSCCHHRCSHLHCQLRHRCSCPRQLRLPHQRPASIAISSTVAVVSGGSGLTVVVLTVTLAAALTVTVGVRRCGTRGRCRRRRGRRRGARGRGGLGAVASVVRAAGGERSGQGSCSDDSAELGTAAHFSLLNSRAVSHVRRDRM